jgi:hypothetical protein
MKLIYNKKDLIAEHLALKAKYMSAKMELITLCEGCREEIYLPEKPKGFIHDCSMPKWLHVDGKRPCYNDESDGVASPMSKYDLEDFYDEIAEDDWLLEDNDDSEK